MQRSGLYHTPTLLMGYAFENWLKGIWVKQNLDEHAEYHVIPNELKSHDLVKLSDKTGLILTDNERKILESLTQFIKWRGRYFIPLDKEDNGKAWENADDLLFLFKNCSEKIDVPDEIRTIASKLKDAYNLPS
jgi:hypothetical protein